MLWRNKSYQHRMRWKIFSLAGWADFALPWRTWSCTTAQVGLQLLPHLWGFHISLLWQYTGWTKAVDLVSRNMILFVPRTICNKSHFETSWNISLMNIFVSTKLSAPAALDILEFSPLLRQVHVFPKRIDKIKQKIHKRWPSPPPLLLIEVLLSAFWQVDLCFRRGHCVTKTFRIIPCDQNVDFFVDGNIVTVMIHDCSEYCWN